MTPEQRSARRRELAAKAVAEVRQRLAGKTYVRSFFHTDHWLGHNWDGAGVWLDGHFLDPYADLPRHIPVAPFGHRPDEWVTKGQYDAAADYNYPPFVLSERRVLGSIEVRAQVFISSRMIRPLAWDLSDSGGCDEFAAVVTRDSAGDVKEIRLILTDK